MEPDELDHGSIGLAAAALAPSTWNAEAGTVEAVWTTGAPVARYTPEWGYCIETLSLDEQHIRLDQLQSGRAPVMDTHGELFFTNGGYTPRTRDVIGVIEGGSVARDSDGDWSLRLRLADTPETQEHRLKVAQGILQNVSLGAKVHHRRLVTDEAAIRAARTALGFEPDEEIAVVEADDWEPFEVSLVPVGADPLAALRSFHKAATGAATHRSRAMEDDEETTGEATPETQPTGEGGAGQPEGTGGGSDGSDGGDSSASDPAPAAAASSGDGEAARSSSRDPRAVYRGFTEDDVRFALAPQDAGQTWRAPRNPSQDQVAALERHRISSIDTACRAAGAGDDLAQQLIGDAVPLTDARQRILDTMSGTQPTHRSATSIVHEERDKVRAGMSNALAHRCGNGELTEAGRAFRGMSLSRMLERSCEQAGIKLPDYSPDSVLRAAMHGSTDFPSLTADVANKSLQRGYARVPASWRPLARRNDAPDFKRINRPRIGAAPKMERLPQGAEIRHGTVAETGESWSLLTYAKALTLTRQAIINDDTDALDRIPAMMGAQTAELESDIVWALITSNPIMAEDGTALFHSDHKNLETGAGSAFSEDALSKARENMRLQVDLDGETQINVNPRWLVVPPQLETKAQKQTASVNPNAADDVNPFASQFQGVIVEARLAADSGTAWYLAADPNLVEMIEYGTLQGNSGPVIESRDSWTHDGVEFRGIYDFGAGVLDFRGLHKSAGV